jgi:hypothetical protein
VVAVVRPLAYLLQALLEQGQQAVAMVLSELVSQSQVELALQTLGLAVVVVLVAPAQEAMVVLA